LFARIYFQAAEGAPLIHRRRQRGEKGPRPLWIFKHGTNIVDRGLKVLFSTFFAIFRYFFANFGYFSVAPPLENFLPTPLLSVSCAYGPGGQSPHLSAMIFTVLFIYVSNFCLITYSEITEKYDSAPLRPAASRGFCKCQGPRAYLGKAFK